MRCFCALCSSEDVRGSVGRDLTRNERLVVQENEAYLEYEVVRSTAVQLGPVFFRQCPAIFQGVMHSVVMHRLGTGPWAVPRFGVFDGVLLHTGPDGIERMLIQVRWHRVSREMYHDVIRAPLAMYGIDATLPTLCLAEDIVPFACFAAPDFCNAQRQIVLTYKNWSCLPLLGFPKIP